MEVQLPDSRGGHSEDIASAVQCVIPLNLLVTFCKDLLIAEDLVNTSPSLVPCATFKFVCKA